MRTSSYSYLGLFTPWLTQTHAHSHQDQSKLGRGTLPYAAPEVLRGSAGSTALDMWAIGIVFVELITGGCEG